MDDCAGLVQCISLERSLVSQSLLDPNKAEGLWGHALFLPAGGSGQSKRQQKHEHKMPNDLGSPASVRTRCPNMSVSECLNATNLTTLTRGSSSAIIQWRYSD